MKYVVDANIIFSALYNMDSNAGELLFLAIEGDVELISPEHIRVELQRVLVQKLGYAPDEVESVVKALPVEWIERALYEEFLEEAKKLLEDEADASLLACAQAFRCDAVTGDRKVLESRFKGVKIKRLREAHQR